MALEKPSPRESGLRSTGELVGNSTSSNLVTQIGLVNGEASTVDLKAPDRTYDILSRRERPNAQASWKFHRPAPREQVRRRTTLWTFPVRRDSKRWIVGCNRPSKITKSRIFPYQCGSEWRSCRSIADLKKSVREPFGTEHRCEADGSSNGASRKQRKSMAEATIRSTPWPAPICFFR